MRSGCQTNSIGVFVDAKYSPSTYKHAVQQLAVRAERSDVHLALCKRRERDAADRDDIHRRLRAAPLIRQARPRVEVEELMRHRDRTHRLRTSGYPAAGLGVVEATAVAVPTFGKTAGRIAAADIVLRKSRRLNFAI